MVIVPLHAIEVIIDEIGINLHQKSKQETKNGRDNPEVLPSTYLPSPRSTYHHGYHCTSERLRTRSKYPCGKTVSLYVIVLRNQLYYLMYK